MSNIKIFKDNEANSIFIEDANGAQFVNSLQASIPNGDDKVFITDLAKQFDIVSNALHTEFVDENENPYLGTPTEICNQLNAIFSSSGTPTDQVPVITSPLAISLVQGETLNYELTANYGVGYEWDLSNVSGVTTVDGNVRKIIGGSSLATGEYAIPVKAINYNGEDSQIIELSVGTPAFANTKSVNFNNNDWCGANAGILDSTLGRSGNGSGSSDAWSISFFFKAGTATNASQTIVYFGSQDVANQGHIQIKYNGSLNRLEMRYGSNNNRLNFATAQNSIAVGQWTQVIVTYDGGTTGAASGSVSDYYSRFKFFIDGVDVTSTNVNSNNNFGYTGSIIGQNWRIGRYNNGQSLRNNCRVDELAIWDSDQSSNSSLIYNNGVPHDLINLSQAPTHWWRMGDGDQYPYLFDVGFEANCIFVMNNMTSADIVSDVP
ncbi:MAG: LamG domain-containing protein [Pseudoalteromonas sp.]|uniref:LamG-like jellyroll fold domain-containing protein n=1 Tax=Pseudoalteromonas sp. TaxID=53249 RepID=UPI001E0E16A8|nr:LamG-like jellyroll fold domain-containing protein [Pseudoalteromonas sp.]NRA78748.1 LamG domain-containing protein [Pseudoalteromonas sp.]